MRRMGSVGGLLAVGWLVGCGTSVEEAAATAAATATEGANDDASSLDAGDAGADAGDEAGDAGNDGADDAIEACDGTAGALEFSEGAYVAQGAPAGVTAMRPRCAGVMHATAGAAGQTLEITLSDWTAGDAARLRVEDLLGTPMVDWTPVSAGDAVSVQLDRSGEVLVRLEPVDILAPSNDYGLSVACVDACDLEYTRHPVLFMHGMAGTDAYLSVLDYWFGLEAYLTAPGFLVEVAAVDAFESTQVRSLQWKAHLDALVEAGIGRRFNLIAHSQGGLDARYLTTHLDDEGRVASVITVATPHRGTAVADLASGIFDDFPVSTSLVEAALDLLGGLLGLGGSELAAQISDFTREKAANFNAQTPDVPGVYYASWAGRSCGALDIPCQLGNEGEVVESFFGPTLTFLNQTDGPNDGLVPVDSAKWGEYMGEVPADHMDEVGQIADVFNPAFDHREFYLAELRRLAARGL